MPKNNSFFFSATLIFLLSFLLYANTLTHQYAVDDAMVITENVFTKKGFSGIKDILTHDTFEGFLGHANDDVAGGRYRPLSLVTFAAEMELFGHNPFINHLINVLLFALTAVSLYSLLRLLLNQGTASSPYFSIPFLATLFFILHPVHTEVVANIKSRDELLAMMGSLSALSLSIKFSDSKKTHFLFLSAIAFFHALLSKENAITFLAVVPLALFLFRDAKGKDYLMVMISLIAGAALYFILRLKYTSITGGEEVTEILNNSFLHASTEQKYATILYALGKYLQLSFFPYELTHDYYFNQVPIKEWSDPVVLLSLPAYVGGIVFALLHFKKKSILSFGVFYFLITISIVSNVLFPVGVILSERFLFMPSWGICLIVAFLVNKLMEEKKLPNWSLRAVLALIVVAGGAKTMARNTVWKDNFTLFSNDVKISSNSTKAHFDLGVELFLRAVEEKDSAKRMNDASLALQEMNIALAIYPAYSFAWLFKGKAYYLQKDFLQSVGCYRTAVAMNPDLQETEAAGISLAYYHLGLYYGKQKNEPDSAIYFMKESVALFQKNPDVYQDLGVVYAMKKDFDNAVAYFTKAVAFRPKDEKLFINLALVYQAKGDTAKASEYFRYAQSLKKSSN